jgi:Family of unknown function (DUF5677)
VTESYWRAIWLGAGGLRRPARRVCAAGHGTGLPGGRARRARAPRAGPPLVRQRSEMSDRPEFLNDVDRVLATGNFNEILRTSAKNILKLITPVIDGISSVEFPVLSVDLSLRCIGKRAEESLSTIISLVDLARGYSAVALLRPLCEDLIFGGWLLTLPRDAADEYVRTRATEEITRAQIAQMKFFPEARRVFGEKGKPVDASEVARIEARLAAVRARLKDFGVKLGWGSRTGPTVRDMAELTNTTDAYDFFYLGASRAVHSSLHQMERMVWGNFETGEFSISSANFEKYHSQFALTYAIWLVARVMSLLERAIPGALEPMDDQAYSVWLALAIIPAVGQDVPPLVTSQELHWPQGPPGHQS